MAKTLTAKFRSTCVRCGGAIAPGSTIEYEKGQGSWHQTCPAKGAAATPAARPAVSVEEAPFEVAEKWEPCKRVYLDAHIRAAIGETRRYVTRGGVSPRGVTSAARKAELGVFVIVGVGPTRYESTEDNEDMGDMSGPGWHVTLYLRRATEEEAERDAAKRFEEALPAVLRQMDAFFRSIERDAARAEMAAAEQREGYGKAALDYLAALGEEVLAARRDARRLWTGLDRDTSYVSTWEHDGATFFESYNHVYDWDQPVVVVGPRAVVERAAVAQALVGFGYAIGRIADRMARVQAGKAA